MFETHLKNIFLLFKKLYMIYIYNIIHCFKFYYIGRYIKITSIVFFLILIFMFVLNSFKYFILSYFYFILPAIFKKQKTSLLFS